MATYVMDVQQPGRPIFVQYTITATAVALSAAAILGTKWTPKKLTVKNASGAANNAYLGPSTVTNVPANAGIELAAGQSFTFEDQGPEEIFIVGTAAAANIAFIEAEW